LGNTIEEIAAEKAAIIVKDARAVIGRQTHQAATEVLMNRCLETGVLPVFVNQPTATEATGLGSVMFNYESAHSNYVRIVSGLRGRHQADNAAAAIESAELFKGFSFPITRQDILQR